MFVMQKQKAASRFKIIKTHYRLQKRTPLQRLHKKRRFKALESGHRFKDIRKKADTASKTSETSGHRFKGFKSGHRFKELLHFFFELAPP